MSVDEVTYIQACVEKNVSECLRLAQDGVNQDDDWVILYVLVHWLLAGLLERKKEREKERKKERKKERNTNTHTMMLLLQSSLSYTKYNPCGSIVFTCPLCSFLFFYCLCYFLFLS